MDLGKGLYETNFGTMLKRNEIQVKLIRLQAVGICIGTGDIAYPGKNYAKHQCGPDKNSSFRIVL